MLGSAPPLRVLSAGDLALAGCFLAAARPKSESALFHFQHLNPYFADSDLVIVNLEGPIGFDGTPRANNRALLYNEPAVLNWLKTLPNPVCILANNHILDFGADALYRTQRLLDENGIYHVGAGSNSAEAERELRLTVNGHSIAIVAATSDEVHVGSILASTSCAGSAGIPDCTAFCRRIALLASEVDSVIVTLHWGHEYFHFPAPAQVTFCRAVAEAGAALVVGHHPHVYQGIEKRGLSLIAYSLGNLLLPPLRMTNGRVQYRKPVSRNFTILKTNLFGREILSSEVICGSWSKRYELTPYVGNEKHESERELSLISNRLFQIDYPSFWESYCRRRKIELYREGFKESLLKIPLMDWKNVLANLSTSDIKRNLARFQALFQR